MAGSLGGTRIIDFGQYIAGPLAAMMLGDQGAEVIRVDPPGGPRHETPANAVWNRGKRRITLDLSDEVDLATARQLASTADVLIENFRPGVMDRLGLSADELIEANPALVYCSLPGFAADDPRAGMPGWEGVVGAATASYQPREAGDEPHYTAVPLASNFAAFAAVNSIVAALIARERTGLGQRIETPLFDAMFEAYGIRGQRAQGAPLAGPPLGGVGPWGGGFYQCQDDRWVQLLVMRPRHFDWFAAACFPDGWAAEGLADKARLRGEPALAADPRSRLTVLFRTKPALEWQTIVNAAGTPFTICQTSEEWLKDEHAIATRSVVSVDDPELGPMTQAGFPVTLSSTPAPDPEPRRALDADRDAIIEELATRPSPAHGPSGVTLSGALDGIRVIDTTQIWAGPTAGRVLAEYGAEVVKINDTSGEVLSHLHVNSGKQSLLLDLKSPAGLELLWKLVERSNVFMQNFKAWYCRADGDRLRGRVVPSSGHRLRVRQCLRLRRPARRPPRVGAGRSIVHRNGAADGWRRAGDAAVRRLRLRHGPDGRVRDPPRAVPSAEDGRGAAGAGRALDDGHAASDAVHVRLRGPQLERTDGTVGEGFRPAATACTRRATAGSSWARARASWRTSPHSWASRTRATSTAMTS